MPRFSLQTALKVRERLEKMYQKALAEELQAEQRIQRQQDLVQEAMADNLSRTNQAKQQGFTVMELQMSQHFERRLERILEVTDEHLRRQQQVVALKRQELTRASQKKRVLEILKEKQEREHYEEMERQERASADEIAQNLRRYRQST
ncbi:MAG: flagellar export protein FliJ [bacterium]